MGARARTWHDHIRDMISTMALNAGVPAKTEVHLSKVSGAASVQDRLLRMDNVLGKSIVTDVCTTVCDTSLSSTIPGHAVAASIVTRGMWSILRTMRAIISRKMWRVLSWGFWEEGLTEGFDATPWLSCLVHQQHLKQDRQACHLCIARTTSMRAMQSLRNG